MAKQMFIEDAYREVSDGNACFRVLAHSSDHRVDTFVVASPTRLRRLRLTPWFWATEPGGPTQLGASLVDQLVGNDERDWSAWLDDSPYILIVVRPTKLRRELATNLLKGLPLDVAAVIHREIMVSRRF